MIFKNLFCFQLVKAKPKYLPESISSLYSILSAYCPQFLPARAYSIPSYKMLQSILYIEDFSAIK